MPDGIAVKGRSTPAKFPARFLASGKCTSHLGFGLGLLILANLGRRRLTGQQFADPYELITSRHRVSSFVITSNRSVEEWLSLFDDPILGNSALDRLANASYQIVIEGASYRGNCRPTGSSWVITEVTIHLLETI